MTERELVELCQEKKTYNKAVRIYWTSELYSFGKYIRKYGFFPEILPLAVYSDHSGPSFYKHVQKHELESEAPVFLSHSKFKVEEYRQITGKKSYVMYSPAVFYRRTNNIKQNKEASGTVAFPVHSLPSEDEEFDIDGYCNQLKQLPDNYKPIKICLHMHDIAKKRNLIYQKYGFELLTAGNSHDYRFIERLYKIISNAKYTTSNDIGTITLYSLEMGIPFFVYGKRQVSYNKSDINFPIGKRNFPDHPLYSHLYNFLKLDNEFNFKKVNEDLLEEVKKFLGIKDGVSRKKMAVILWYAFFSWLFSRRSLTHFKKKLQN